MPPGSALTEKARLRPQTWSPARKTRRPAPSGLNGGGGPPHIGQPDRHARGHDRRPVGQKFHPGHGQKAHQGIDERPPRQGTRTSVTSKSHKPRRRGRANPCSLPRPSCAKEAPSVQAPRANIQRNSTPTGDGAGKGAQRSPGAERRLRRPRRPKRSISCRPADARP